MIILEFNKFREEFDTLIYTARDTSMGPNPEDFGSNLSRNISPNATKFFHTCTCTNICRLLTDTYPDFTNKVQNGRN